MEAAVLVVVLDTAAAETGGRSRNPPYFTSASERHPACERCLRLCMDASWTIKKAEHPRINAFELWCWRRLLRVSWTARRSNQSILKEISPDWKDWCWSWGSSTLATWFEEPAHWKRSWCWERLKAKRKEGSRGWDTYIASPTQWTLIWANSKRQRKTEKPGVLQSMGLQRIEHNYATEQQQLHFLQLLFCVLCVIFWNLCPMSLIWSSEK